MRTRVIYYMYFSRVITGVYIRIHALYRGYSIMYKTRVSDFGYNRIWPLTPNLSLFWEIFGQKNQENTD